MGRTGRNIRVPRGRLAPFFFFSFFFFFSRGGRRGAPGGSRGAIRRCSVKLLQAFGFQIHIRRFHDSAGFILVWYAEHGLFQYRICFAGRI